MTNNDSIVVVVFERNSEGRNKQKEHWTTKCRIKVKDEVNSYGNKNVRRNYGITPIVERLSYFEKIET
jgi:hypothetical protein